MVSEYLTKEDFSKRLKEALDKKGITQAALADQVGSTAANISNYVRGNAFPPVDMLAAIASVLNVSTDYLCGLEQPNQDKTPLFESFGDVARAFIELNRTVPSVQLRKVTYTDIYKQIDRETGYCEEYNIPQERFALVFFDSELAQFMIDWDKVKQVCKDIEMGDTLYEPWLKKRLEDLDSIPVFDELEGNVLEGELPF